MIEDKNSRDINKIIGENVKHLRKAKKMSQLDLAEAWAYAQESSISKIENGHFDIPISRLEEICNYFDVPISFICKKHDWGEINLNETIKNTMEAEESKEIIKAAVIINRVFANIIGEPYQTDLATEVNNILNPYK